MARVGALSQSPFEMMEYNAHPLTPLWTIEGLDDPEKEKDVEDWMENAVNNCASYYSDLIQVQMDNLLLYRGIQWINQDRYSNRFLDKQGSPSRRSPRVVINHLYDFVEQWVSRLTRFKPAVAIYPTNTEYQDEEDSRIAKLVLDHIWYERTIDWYLQEFARQAKIFGESYLWITFDPNKGDLHPDWIKMQSQLSQMGQPSSRSAILGPDGNPVKSYKGDVLMAQKAVRTGDIRYDIDAPWHTFDMPCSNRDDVDWAIRWKAMDIDYIRAKYPEKADKIHADNSNEVFVNYRLDVGKMSNQVIVYELYHRHSEFLDKGRYIKRVKGCILENTELPYSHGKIPYVRFTDIDVPDQIRGMSFFQQLFPIQHQINACASLIFKSLVLFAHPKFVMPDGAADITQLLDQSTVVTYQGGVPPTLLAQSPVSPDLFTYQDKLTAIAEKISGIFSISRGQAPSGVRAGKALRVLEEQEDKRAYILNTKFNQAGMVDNAKMTLATAGDYYDDSDGRLARVVGSDNEFSIIRFKTANLSKPYDIRVENTTALSQSPSARLEELNEMAQIQLPPDSIITREQYINFADLGRSEEFKDIATRAVRTAKIETQKILAGEEVPLPTGDEDLINHWKIHLQPVQGMDYKTKVPEDRKARLREHIYSTEVLMFKKAFGVLDPATGMYLAAPNQMFQQKMLLECVNWPVYFEFPPGYMAPPMQAPMSGASGLMDPTRLEGDPSVAPPIR